MTMRSKVHHEGRESTEIFRSRGREDGETVGAHDGGQRERKQMPVTRSRLLKGNSGQPVPALPFAMRTSNITSSSCSTSMRSIGVVRSSRSVPSRRMRAVSNSPDTARLAVVINGSRNCSGTGSAVNGMLEYGRVISHAGEPSHIDLVGRLKRGFWSAFTYSPGALLNEKAAISSDRHCYSGRGFDGP